MNVHHAMVRTRLLKPNFALDKLVSDFSIIYILNLVKILMKATIFPFDV